jgi:hypothetical protein
MAPEFEVLDEFVRSKQMIVFFIFMAIISVLFHPILGLKRKRALELQESIKDSARGRFEGFGGTSLKRVE